MNNLELMAIAEAPLEVDPLPQSLPAEILTPPIDMDTYYLAPGRVGRYRLLKPIPVRVIFSSEDDPYYSMTFTLKDDRPNASNGEESEDGEKEDHQPALLAKYSVSGSNFLDARMKMMERLASLREWTDLYEGTSMDTSIIQAMRRQLPFRRIPTNSTAY